MKKALALLLVVITLFSVMTIAVSAADDPIKTFPIDDANLNIFFNLKDTLNTLGAWFEGLGTFLFSVCIEPILLILSPIFGFEVVPAA